MSEMTGHCLCGAVTYEGQGERGRVHLCHCSDCVRWTGGPFMGLQFSDGLTIKTGDVNWYDSSDWGERGSCSKCGSTLFWRLKQDHKITIVTAGSLDDTSDLEPIEEHIFIDHKPDYYDFAGDVPRLTGAEVFARLQEQQND